MWFALEILTFALETIVTLAKHSFFGNFPNDKFNIYVQFIGHNVNLIWFEERRKKNEKISELNSNVEKWSTFNAKRSYLIFVLNWTEKEREEAESHKKLRISFDYPDFA